MDVYVPILGLKKFGLDPLQLLEVRNTDAPSISTLPPATNVNHSLQNLLMLIDNIYGTRKDRHIRNKKELHTVFKFPTLNNPEIFHGQYQLDSIGLGILIKAVDATKLHSVKCRFDFVCVTGVIKKYPSDKEIISGDFLNDATGEIDRKF